LTESFDIVNYPENRESEQRLFQLIESGKAVLFIGSGSSRRLGYPSWEGILNNLKDLFENESDITLVEQKINDGDLLLAAEIIKNKTTIEQYSLKFEEFFKAKEPPYDDFHRLLMNVKFTGFVTTNYDPIIEYALKSTQNPHSNYGIIISKKNKSFIHYFLNSVINSVNWNERFHLYLHGKYNDSASIILSYGDYVRKYHGLNIKEQILYSDLIAGSIDIKNFESKTDLKNNAFRTLHYKTIYLLMATQRIVFFGYGLRDPYLNKIIDDIKDDFSPGYKSNHYVLFSKNEANNWTTPDYLIKKKEWRDKGIELVFYKDDDSYSGIEEFVKGLSPDSFIAPSIKPPHDDDNMVAELETLVAIKEIEDESINEKLISKVKKTAEELKKK
jgi:hypothetical protein